MNTTVEAAFRILSTSVIRYFFLAGIPFVLFYLLFPQKVSRQKIQQRMASKKDFIREIVHSVQSTLIFTAIVLIILYTPVKNHTRIYSGLHDFPLWYIPVSLLLSLIVHDTYFYWMHRLLHHKRLFKLTHLVHHKSTNPSPWASYSFHFLESIAEGLILFLITMLIPMHFYTILLFTISAFIINVYGHLGYEIMPRQFRHSLLFQIFNTSVHHNLHHSKFKGNYGLYFRFWDRLMGTEYPDYVKEYDKVQQRRFGNKIQTPAHRKASIASEVR